MPRVGKQKRLTATDLEVEKGYSLAAARAEATRCLQCECPSNGACDLQTLGVEYDVTDNDLVVKGNLVREVEPQYEHPFIRRDMSRCIACGKCVRVCRDVAGPACYDFTGRGFTINVDTPYSDALQLADCITCGRCVTDCPTGALTFNERELASFRVDESRCILCHECVDVCPVDAIKDTNHFEDARDQVARARVQGQRARRRSPHVRRLRRPDRRAPDPDGHGRPGRRLGGHRLPRGEHHHLPVHLVEGQLHPHRLRELGRDALRRRDRVSRPQEEGPHGGGDQVHRLRRRRRHLRHRPAVALRRHGARPPDAVRLLRQRRLHEHRLPALRRDAAGRLDDHQPGRARRSRARSRTARTSPTS